MSNRFKLVAIALAVFLTATGHADIRDSSEWIVGRRQHTAIKRLRDHIDAPEKLKPGEVYVLIEAGAAYATVHVVGELKTDAKAYARLLDEWSPEDAVYSQEDDYAAAATYIKRNAWFTTESSLELNIKDLLTRLRASGLRPYPGISVFKYASVNPSDLPMIHKGTNTDLYDAERANTIRISARLTPIQTVGPWIMLFGPLLVMVTTFGLAFNVAKNRNIEVERRRKLFTTLVSKPPFIAIGICLPFALYLMFTRQLYPLADLWFGERSVSIFILLLLPTFLIPMFVLAPITKVENKLFGPRPDEPGQEVEAKRVIEARFTDTTLQKKLVWVAWSLGLALFLSSLALPKQLTEVAMFMRIGGMVVIFASDWLSRLIARRVDRPVAAEVSDEPFVRRVQRLAHAFRRPVDEVTVVEGPDGQGSLGVAYVQGTLTISQKAVTELPEPELDFAIASALSRDTGRVIWMSMLLLLPLALLGALLMPFWRTLLPAPGSLFLAMAPSFLVISFGMRRMMRHDAKRSFERALAVTRNSQAARSYLEKYHAELDPKLSRRQRKHLAETMIDFERACLKLPKA